MPAAFLHGVETINVGTGARPVQQLRSNVIGIVGTAPMGAVNTLTLCLSDTDDVQFGIDTVGYTLPSALASLRATGAGAIFVINVFDPRMITPASLTLADIIGGMDAHGRRTGLALLVEGYGEYGFDAKLLIAPNFSSAPSVAAALETMAIKLKGMAYIDLPIGLTYSEAITARSGAVAGLSIHQSSSDRVRFCYPHIKRFDPVTSSNVLEPLSIRAAGLRAQVDRDVGYWTSSSNHTLQGVLGLERTLTSRINDPDSEVNALNAAGITTVFNSFGTGFRLWGNRSVAFPVSTLPENFEQVRRTRDMIEGALEEASLQFTDLDIDPAQMDGLVETVNGFLRSLYGRKAIMGGECWFDPARTPASELTAGQIRVQYKFTPKYPMERITFESEIVVDYLITLKRTSAGATV